MEGDRALGDEEGTREQFVQIAEEKELYITSGTWSNNADPISTNTASKNRRTFGPHINLILDRPDRLNAGKEITGINAAYVGAGSDRVAYQSSAGIIIKIEAISDHHATSIAEEDKVRM